MIDMPDRIVLLPGCCFAFVEVKAPGEKPRPLQLSRHRLLRRLGFPVYVLDAEEQIGGTDIAPRADTSCTVSLAAGLGVIAAAARGSVASNILLVCAS